MATLCDQAAAIEIGMRMHEHFTKQIGSKAMRAFRWHLMKDMLLSEKSVFICSRQFGKTALNCHMADALTYGLGAFTITPKEKIMNTTSNRAKRWSFAAPHAAAIDFASIANDLSYKEPIALVRDTKGEPGDLAWVVIHYKILLKAQILEHPLWAALNTGESPYPVRNGSGSRVKRLPLSDSTKIIKLVKEVKNTPWPRGGIDGKRRKIEVTLPRV